MRISTAFNHERRLKRIADDIHFWAISSGKSHDDILEDRNKRLFGDPAWNKVPGWVRAVVMEYDQNLFDSHYLPHDSIGYPIHSKDLEQRILDERQDAKEPGSVHPHRLRPFAYIRWQLRLDGEFVTSSEISDKHDAGDEDVWNRVEGALIWNHNWRPYSPWSRVNKR